MGAGSLLVKLVDGRIAATSDEMQFFFSGPKLDLFVSPTSLIAAFVMVVVVTAISTLYPAIQATRVSPVTAMQSEE
jgi:ABC-type lipoprotein release transport system permease subunit